MIAKGGGEAPRGRGCVEKMFLTPWNYQQHELLIQGRMDCHHHPHHPVAFLSHWISLTLFLWPATAHSCFPFSQTVTNKNKIFGCCENASRSAVWEKLHGRVWHSETLHCDPAQFWTMSMGRQESNYVPVIGWLGIYMYDWYIDWYIDLYKKIDSRR